MKSIVPLAEVPRAQVEQYLTTCTKYFREHGPAAVGWKYYDERFNRGRNRGYVWWRDDRVRGLIGIVPATIARGSEQHPFAWTCDWGLDDPKAAPGIGVMLLRKVLAAAPYAATAGGNHNTRSLVPRLAAHTEEQAATYYWWPLRSSALLHLASARFPVLGQAARSVLGRVPIPTLPRRSHARACDGIAPELESLFARLAAPTWQVRYDLEHLRWALERCPGLACGTVVVDGGRGPVAAAVWWYPEAAPVRHVRFAVWREPGAEDAARDVVQQVFASARTAGGGLISALAETSDPALTALLERQPMIGRTARLPLYVFSPSVDRLGGVNYLATDLAQRFRGTAG